MIVIYREQFDNVMLIIAWFSYIWINLILLYLNKLYSPYRLQEFFYSLISVTTEFIIKKIFSCIIYYIDSGIYSSKELIMLSWLALLIN